MRKPLTALLLAAGVALSACSAPEDDKPEGAAPPTSSATVAAAVKDAAAAALLPEAIRSAGVIRVASGVSFPPMEYFDTDNKTVIGFDADLAKALGEVLGVRFSIENVAFDGIVGGISAGRYDIGITSMLDKPQRREQVDFVDYLKSGAALLVPAGNPDGVTDVLGMCGRKVAVEKASTGDLLVDDVTKKCGEAGKAGIEKLPFPDQASAVQALQTRRADIVAALDLTAAYTVKQNPGQFDVPVDAVDPLPVGIAVPKTNPQLRDAVQAALRVLVQTGTYDQLLAKWNLQGQSFKDATINGGAG